MFATSLALLANEFHGRERGTAFGIWGATTGGAVAIGPLAGGIVTEALGWRWIFLLNVPIGIAALVVTLLRVGESRDPEHGGVDLGGVLTFSGGLFLLVYGLVRGNTAGWGSIEIVAVLAGSAILLLAFVVIELRSSHPMLDLGLFRGAGVRGRADRGVRALGVGVRDLPLPDAVHAEHPRLLAARDRDPLPPDLAARVRRRADLGEALEQHARAGADRRRARGVRARVRAHARHHVDVGLDALLPGFVLARDRDRARQPAARSTAVSVVPPQSTGMGSGANTTFRQVGIATGVAVLGAVFEHHLTSSLGAAGRAAATGVVPPSLRETAENAFVTGLDQLFVITGVIAAVGAVPDLPSHPRPRLPGAARRLTRPRSSEVGRHARPRRCRAGGPSRARA